MHQEVQAPPGCTSIDALIVPEGRATFVRGGASAGGEGLVVHYFRRDADGALVGRIVFGPACQGPPGHAHGGSMAAVLDDAMGVAAWIAGHPVVAAEIRIRFKSMLPLGAVIALEAKVESVEGKKVNTVGRLVPWDAMFPSEGEPAAEPAPYSTGEGVFIRIGARRFVELGERAG